MATVSPAFTPVSTWHKGGELSIDRSPRFTFEEVANLYNEALPGYPEELIADIFSLSQMPADGRILEIGCGPGNATEMFARHGREILAIELGERQASRAAYPKVSVLNTSFEWWQAEAVAFELAVAAGAYDWIPPEISYPKVSDALYAFGSEAALGTSAKTAAAAEIHCSRSSRHRSRLIW
jgi:SAM-dependent methyltransferase